ncbi:hypothetical protein RJ639_026396 [Escallonia herrerae]|uniref:GST C-terminal domain-containing protein n=1 Tax=Escallonia herrerae TaxID=1293975 RepID=A0AA88S755_9ASTE|nr:hypothetical protein RJ639_026396 [Escallonia herrerae]
MSSTTIQEKFYKTAFMTFCSTGEDRAKGLESTAELLEGEISGKKYLGGEELGFLDIAAGWTAHRFQFLEEVLAMDSTIYPAFTSWIEKFLDVPVIRENLSTSGRIAPRLLEVQIVDVILVSMN